MHSAQCSTRQEVLCKNVCQGLTKHISFQIFQKRFGENPSSQKANFLPEIWNMVTMELSQCSIKPTHIVEHMLNLMFCADLEWCEEHCCDTLVIISSLSSDEISGVARRVRGCRSHQVTCTGRGWHHYLPKILKPWHFKIILSCYISIYVLFCAECNETIPIEIYFIERYG